MSTRAQLIALLLAIGCAGLAGTSRGAAQDVYAGKRLSILVNFDAGGPNDIEARLIARHIGRHIPGNPAIIVQNMGGAGGMVGARWLGEVAPRDGSIIGYFTAAPQRYALAPERYTVDLKTYEYVAYMPNGRIHFVRTDLDPRLTTGADVIKAAGVVAGGLAAEAPKDMAMRLVLDMLGVKYKYVTGYNSTTRAMLAFQRGEINLWSDSASSWLTNVVPVYQVGRDVVPICYDPYIHNGNVVVPRQIRTLSIASCLDLLAATKGGMPKGDAADAYMALLSFAGVMYRTMVFPPQVPKEAVSILRQAMSRLNEDKEYQEEAARVIGEAPEYIISADLNAEAQRMMTISPAVKQFLADYSKRSGEKK